MIYDGNGSRFGDAGPTGSGEIESIFSAWFDAQGMATQETALTAVRLWTVHLDRDLCGWAVHGRRAAQDKRRGDTLRRRGRGHDAAITEIVTTSRISISMFLMRWQVAAHATMSLAFYEGVLGGKARSLLRLPDWLPSSCAAHERIWRR